VLFVGRLVAKKGVDLLLAAAEDAYHLLLVGERGRVELPPRPSVELRPFLDRANLAGLLRAADVLVLPSRGEGFPLVAQEAMASGLAVVLADDPAWADLGRTGAARLVPLEVAALRRALAELAARPEQRAELGRRAREHACARWSPGPCRQRLLDTYRRLAGAK
jgi:glycosyltransferase involved in cell wall biosynthesis